MLREPEDGRPDASLHRRSDRYSARGGVKHARAAQMRYGQRRHGHLASGSRARSHTARTLKFWHLRGARSLLSVGAKFGVVGPGAGPGGEGGQMKLDRRPDAASCGHAVR